LMLDEHGRGRRDHSTQLWALFMLELWHRSVVERSADEPATVGKELTPVVA